MAKAKKSVPTHKAAAAAKQALIAAQKLEAAQAAAAPQVAAKGPTAKALLGNFAKYQAGSFENLDRIRLRWTEPDFFEFVPRAAQPFAFVRPNGDRIEPRNFFTDGGSIPRFVGAFNGRLTPWGYAPGYLIHDWEFDRHHCGGPKTFDAVRDTLMEALKTLMVKKIVPQDELAFDLIYHGVSSFIAKGAWNNNPPVCPIPPEKPE